MTSYIKHGSTRRSDDTMDDDTDDKDDTKRKSRNLSEKKRRDQFNMLINELSSMVSTNNRKMDKSTVLKSTISFLKNHNEMAVRSRAHEIQEDWKPSFLSNEEFTHLILEALDGFIIVFSSTGRIFYASESVTSLLGHLPSDLLNMTIYDLVYEEDQSALYNVLLNPAISVDSVHYGDLKENQVTFSCHMKRGGLEAQEDVVYELVQFIGYFRSDIDPMDVENLISSGNRFNNFSSETDTRLMFVGTGRLQIPLLIREMSIVDSAKSEFTSRHSLEWKFLYLDHRAPPIIGYLPFEVLGTSGYDYYHVDDLDKVVTCHEALMQKGEGTSCHYRFLTKGQQWIWLQTRFYITYHQWNSKPEFVVCTHRVVSYLDVMRQLRKNPDDPDPNPEGDDENRLNGDLQDKQACVITPTQSDIAANHWPSKSSDIHLPHLPTSSTSVVKSHVCPPVIARAGSDSNSMSADSPASRQSQITAQSTISEATSSMIPVKRSRTVIQQQQQQPPPPSVNKPILTVAPSHQIATPASTFLEPQQQYVAAIPVQPVIAAGFPGPTAVVTSLTPPDLMRQTISMTPAQSQIQEHLQRKHEELQQIIVQQQEELRRVSEQLLMARYGLLPSLQLNVTLPYNVTGATVSSTTSSLGHEGNANNSGVHVPVSSDLFVGAHTPLTVTTVSRSAPAGQQQSIMIDPHQVNLQAHTTEEVIPFQLSQQQAQVLFSSPNSTQHR